MIFFITVGLLFIFSAYYFYFIIRIRIGVNSLQYARPIDSFPFVSVIVAARNEEKNIERCLNSLFNQSYPADKYEVIIINDASIDKTGSVAESFKSRFTNLHLISISNFDNMNSGNKTIALTKGISSAAGKIILTTDADCTVSSRWVEIMVSHFINDVVFVAGPVREQSSGTLFSKLEELEFLGLITTAAGLIGTDRPIICNGANLAYLKSAFDKVGGYGKNNVSNDDEYLMNKFVRNKTGEIVFAPDYEAIVVTDSSNTISSFLTQRIRWANKRRHYSDISIFFTLVLLYLFFFSFMLNSLLLFIYPQIFFPLILVFTGKVMVEYFTLRTGARMFHMSIRILHFLIAEIFHVPYIAIAAPIGQFTSIIWKGRKI